MRLLVVLLRHSSSVLYFQTITPRFLFSEEAHPELDGSKDGDAGIDSLPYPTNNDVAVSTEMVMAAKLFTIC